MYCLFCYLISVLFYSVYIFASSSSSSSASASTSTFNFSSSSNYLVFLQYVTEPKVYSVQISFSIYVKVYSPKNYRSSRNPTYVQYLTALTSTMSTTRNPKNTASTPHHPKMGSLKFLIKHLNHLPQTTNDSSHMLQKLNSPIIVIPPPSPSNSETLSQRIPLIYQ